MRETAASGLEAAGLYRTVGIPVVEGLAGFHRVAYDPAVVLLLPVRFDLWQIGGSHAQRDVVNWTLTEAAVRAGQRDVALSLAHERLGIRPRNAPNRRFLRHTTAICLAMRFCRKGMFWSEVAKTSIPAFAARSSKSPFNSPAQPI